MNLPAHIDGLAAASTLPARPLHLAIGMFDGVHLGHLAVVEAAVASARQAEGIAAALTFDPHPSRVLRPEAAVPLLSPAWLKAERLMAAGVSAVITQPFTREYAAIAAEDFVAHLRQSLPALQAIYVGENWRFGRGRAGDVTTLQQLGQAAGVRIFSAPRVSMDGLPISSTRIRDALTAGEMETANALLGYTYYSRGRVVAGQQLGRKIGFPTLNLPWVPECQPRRGVYAVRVTRDGDDQVWAGVANYGVRPTVMGDTDLAPGLEVHLFAPPAFGEGTELRVEWCAFLRPEQRFEDVEALRAQIGRDRQAATAYFAPPR